MSFHTNYTWLYLQEQECMQTMAYELMGCFQEFSIIFLISSEQL